MLVFYISATIAFLAGPAARPWVSGWDRSPFTVPPAHTSRTENPRAYSPQSDPADSLYNAANDALNAGDFREAVRILEQLISLYPESTHVADALYWRAFNLYRIGEDDGLRQGLESLRAMNERFPKTFLDTDAAALAQRILGELGRRGDPEATKILILKARAEQRQAAADSQQIATSCDPQNPDAPGADVKIAALNALVQVDTQRAVATLQELLQHREESFVCLRRAAILLLAQQRAQGVEMSLSDAARADPDFEVRKQAVLSLSQYNTAEAVGALDSIARTAVEPALVEPAVIALSQSSDPRAQEALRAYAGREEVPLDLRRTAIQWLAERPSPENMAFLKELFGRINTTNTELRRSIIQAVWQQQDSATGRWLLDVARSDGDSLELRTQALALALQIATTSDLAATYAPTLAPALRTPLIDTYTARAAETVALDALGTVALIDPDVELRRKAVASISQSGNSHAAEVLQRIVRGGS